MPAMVIKHEGAKGKQKTHISNLEDLQTVLRVPKECIIRYLRQELSLSEEGIEKGDNSLEGKQDLENLNDLLDK